MGSESVHSESSFCDGVGAGTKGVFGRPSRRAIFAGSSVKTPRQGLDREKPIRLELARCGRGSSNCTQMDCIVENDLRDGEFANHGILRKLSPRFRGEDEIMR
jgi:hypothetical protein